MKRIFIILMIAGLSGILLSCHRYAHTGSEAEEPESTEATTDVVEDNEPHPIALTEQQREFVRDNNAFTLNFLKTVNASDKSGKSFIYSPLSITYVLSMVNDAAKGTTQKELEQTLGFRNGGIKEVNQFCKTLIDSLPMVDQEVQLHIANAIFVNKNSQLKSQFQKDMMDFYQAKAESLDFASDKSLKRINGWCNDKTKGMIPEILDELNPDAVSYLLNAIYFKANWTNEFEEAMTKADTFTTAKGPVMLPLMQQMKQFSYVKNNTFSAVELPYSNRQWSMTVMLPEKGKSTDDVINYLAKNGMSFLDETRSRKVDLKLPRFETESSTEDLIGTLKKLGITRVFDSFSAEVPNLCESNVYIGMMLQKARIKVNETGSEAAAVTVAGMLECTSLPKPEEPVKFYANRPFVYVIREESTGVILFVGKFTGE
ncbi:MAG: serpin family protein [Bacteroidales bacterium]|nr:serpin family protein [Bacteroidales bacterium]